MFYLSNNTKIVVYVSKLIKKLGVIIKDYRRAVHHSRRRERVENAKKMLILGDGPEQRVFNEQPYCFR